MTKFTILRRSLALLVLLALISVNGIRGGAIDHKPKLDRYEYTEYHMGVDVRIVVYSESKAKAEKACAAAFERFARLDTIMSDYRVDSELMLLCEKAGGSPAYVSSELYRVLERSQQLAEQSDGAFDVTCSPIVRLWRTARKTHVLPKQAELAGAVALTGWKNMRLNPDEQTVELTKPGMMLDLGAIGKGYADDLVQQELRRHGITRALVEAGGDIVVTGAPPGEIGWRLKVETKYDGLPGADPNDSTMMRVANCAISSSGDTEQFVDIGGKRYSHVVDPRTGQALTNRLAVLVIARDGLTSDGLSTAVSVMGAEKGRELVKKYRGARVWVGRD